MKRIAWSTDIHLNFADEPTLSEYLTRLRDVSPDMVLVSGDIAESHNLVDYLSVLSHNLDCRIAFVLGNHDFYRGSIVRVREEVRALCARHDNLLYLTDAPCVEIGEDVGLFGHDGWADARAGDYDSSTVMMNDYLLIGELARLNKDELRGVLHGLGDAAAKSVRELLPAALEQFAQVFFVTHVPPLREACWYNGRIANDEWAPHFTCTAVGDALLEISDQYPDRQITVLCGHTHSPGVYSPTPHLRIITGGAEYGFPTINQVFCV